MEKQEMKEIEIILLKKRAEGQHITFEELVELMRSKRPQSTIREIFETVQRLLGGKYSHITITPLSVLDFTRAIIHHSGCKRLYVPLASGIELEEFASTVITIDYTSPRPFVRGLMKEKSGIEPIAENNLNDSEYDIIYSDGIQFAPLDKGFRDLLVTSLTRLTEKGVAILTDTSGVVWDRKRNSYIKELSKKGVFVSAVIDLPAGLYRPFTIIRTKLILFTRTQNDKLFLARMDNESDAAVIANNFFYSRTDSSNPEFGVWVDRNSFVDYNQYECQKRLDEEIKENNERLKRVVAKTGKSYKADMLPISEISIAINTLNSSNESFVDAENAVYVRDEEVTTSLNDLKSDQCDYTQILVDQEKILPEFLVFFLRTENGKTILRLSSIPQNIPSSIRRSRPTPLHKEMNPCPPDFNNIEIKVPVPPHRTQMEILKVHDELKQIERETSILKAKLMTSPGFYPEVRKEIKCINNPHDAITRWIDTLPYPLATILKRYSTADSGQQKQDLLFFFFEAYSIFAAAILTAVYKESHINDKRLEEVNFESFQNASFGSWVKIDSVLSTVFNDNLNNSDMFNTILKCFHTDDPAVVKLLCLSKVYSLLTDVSRDRNKWKGHSGIASPAIFDDQARVLGEKLSLLQELLLDLYDKIRLIKPVPRGISCQNGKIINKVEILTGSDSIFRKEDIVGVPPLDEEKLYIQVSDTQNVFEIPPFFVLKNSPADVKNACYFFNRLEGSNSRYVSYHFENKPEDIEEGMAVIVVIKEVLSPSAN